MSGLFLYTSEKQREKAQRLKTFFFFFFCSLVVEKYQRSLLKAKLLGWSLGKKGCFQSSVVEKLRQCRKTVQYYLQHKVIEWKAVKKRCKFLMLLMCVFHCFSSESCQWCGFFNSKSSYYKSKFPRCFCSKDYFWVLIKTFRLSYSSSCYISFMFRFWKWLPS